MMNVMKIIEILKMQVIKMIIMNAKEMVIWLFFVCFFFVLDPSYDLDRPPSINAKRILELS